MNLYGVKKIEGPIPYYVVKDVLGALVCKCEKEHDARLICRLLNKHT